MTLPALSFSVSSRLYLKGAYNEEKARSGPLPCAIVFALVEVSSKRVGKGSDAVMLIKFRPNLFPCTEK